MLMCGALKFAQIISGAAPEGFLISTDAALKISATPASSLRAAGLEMWRD